MKTIALRYGMLFFAGLLSFFLIGYALGLSDRYDLRMLNGVMHVVALYYGIRQLRLRQPETQHNYVSGVAQGMYIGLVGTLPFAIFITVFLGLNPSFLAELQAASNVGEALTPITGGAIIFLEGIGVSLIASYLLTRYVDMRLEQKQGGNGGAYAR